ncbi:hexokinase-2-like isoform X2 [Acanthaster planci]|uniref:Phosphotransferase n=1 Tax=Acanthaster planci TaxID=133434 RepID=A0A8B7YWP2_ACAPL|nr:hexokinase-2-like isoform X2 [Acanthaster planci]
MKTPKWVNVGGRWIRATPASNISEKTVSTKSTKNEVDEILQKLALSNAHLEEITSLMRQNMDRGLDSATHQSAIVKMFPSFVRSLPDGSEKGDFFALDLGGSNFRVLRVQLLEGDVQMTSKVYKIAEETMTGTGDQLFDYIADCLSEFKKEEGLGDVDLPLGFTFSFPCKQNGLASAELVQWTKGFSASGVVGKDVVQLLKEACVRKNVNLHIVALVNDTVGTLMSCAYSRSDAYIGLILGTGTNACYLEKLSNVGTWTGDSGEPTNVIINMEWGAFGSDGALDNFRTEFDKQVDEVTPNKGKQLYEKMISGMYLGEIVRLILVKLTTDGHLFGGKVSPDLNTPWKFETRFLTDIESDTSSDNGECRTILTSLGVTPSVSDLATVRRICEAVSTRAARLAVAGLSAVIRKMGAGELTIAVDGSLYKKHPTFKSNMEATLQELVPGVTIKLMLSEDGSGKGAALVAAVAARISS